MEKTAEKMFVILLTMDGEDYDGYAEIVGAHFDSKSAIEAFESKKKELIEDSDPDESEVGADEPGYFELTDFANDFRAKLCLRSVGVI